MKYFAFLVVLCCLNILALAQEFDSTLHQNLRRYALQLDAQNRSVLSEFFSLHDSLPAKNKLLALRYDSLLHDSAFAASPSLGLARADAALCSMRRDGALKHYSELKNAYNALNGMDHFSEYHQMLTSFMQQLAVEANDYAMAYSLQNTVHAAMYAQWEDLFAAQLDSMKGIELALVDDQEMAEKNRLQSKHDEAQLKLIGGVSMGLLAMAIVVLTVLSGRSKTRLKRALKQAGDNTEKETLVMKLEAARQEVNTLKVAARKQVEAPKLTVAAPEAAAFDDIQLKQWNEEIQLGLAKIKSHCEAGKNSMSVPTYMAIVNDTTRLSNQVLKRAQEWSNGNSSK